MGAKCGIIDRAGGVINEKGYSVEEIFGSFFFELKRGITLLARTILFHFLQNQ